MDQYIVNVYLTYASDIACQDCVGHATLEEGAGTLQAHCYPSPLEKSVLSNESSVFLRIRMELGLMIAGGEVDDAEHFGLQSSDPVDYLLDVRDGPTFQRSSG